MSGQISRFAMVGFVGFIADSLIFLFLSAISDNLLINRLIAFWLAACTTFLGNRYFTFSACNQRPLRQWCKHMLSCHLSGVLNIVVFYVCCQFTHTYVAFLLGIALGTISNYLLSSLVVFSTKRSLQG